MMGGSVLKIFIDGDDFRGGLLVPRLSLVVRR
jgi:hypothetical protein